MTIYLIKNFLHVFVCDCVCNDDYEVYHNWPNAKLYLNPEYSETLWSNDDLIQLLRNPYDVEQATGSARQLRQEKEPRAPRKEHVILEYKR